MKLKAVDEKKEKLDQEKKKQREVFVSQDQEVTNLNYIESKEEILPLVIHPIVLLSVVDHYQRLQKGTNKRVVGCLLGEKRDKELHQCTSYQVPFEEEQRDPSVFFLDRNYNEELQEMNHKCNQNQSIIGWYSSGPKIKPQDIQIHEMFRKYCPEPVFVILDTQPKTTEIGSLPIEQYYSVQEKTFDKVFCRTFKSIPCSFGQDEAEEIGVEHLLRDLKNAGTSTLSKDIQNKQAQMKQLEHRLGELKLYLEGVLSDKFPYNTQILNKIQDLFCILPEMSLNQKMVESCNHESNDQYLSIYIGQMIRQILSLHKLIDNKIKNREQKEEREEKRKEKEEELQKKKKKEQQKKEKTI